MVNTVENVLSFYDPTLGSLWNSVKDEKQTLKSPHEKWVSFLLLSSFLFLLSCFFLAPWSLPSCCSGGLAIITQGGGAEVLMWL